MGKKNKKKYNLGFEIIKFLILIGISISLYYFNEKAKNMATKQDIGNITKIVEDIKSDIKEREEIQSKRRDVYTELAKSMKIFVNGSGTPELNEKFYNDYSTMWLWANDKTIAEINNFLDIMLQVTASPGSVPQDTMKFYYTKCMIAMRKEILPNSTLDENDFKFIKLD